MSKEESFPLPDPADMGRRRFTRRSMEVEIGVEDGFGEGELLFESEDVSPNGIFLRTEFLFESGEEILLRFKLPGKEEKTQVSARVVRVIDNYQDPESGEKTIPGMGLEFTSLDEETWEELCRYTMMPG